MIAFVLLSGGIDSAVLLHLIQSQRLNIRAVTFFYGQRHGYQEMSCAEELCTWCSVNHTTLSLDVPRCALTDPAQPLPRVAYDQIEGLSPAYVPNRNMLMLAHTCAHILGNHPRAPDGYTIYIGVHAEDAHRWAYPDCTPEFIGAMANAIYWGSDRNVRLATPFQHMTKAKIIELGERLDVPWKLTWSCYEGDKLHCGLCPTCRARRAAFKAAEVYDQTEYMAIA